MEQLQEKDKEKLLDEISELVENHYVYPDLGEDYGEEISFLSRSHKFDGINDPKQFGENVTTVLQELMNDKHINFRLIETSELNNTTAGSLHHPVRYFRLGQKEHLGFYRLDWIEDEIGYLDYRRFYHHSRAREMWLNAIQFLSTANAIIIDLRENGGGSGDMGTLMLSYFLPHPTQLTGTYYREGDMTKEMWTHEKVTGKKFPDVPLFVIIGKKTFSAAEYFAYDLKVRKRATLIGEASKGGAHSVDRYPVGDNFEIYISTARAVNPVTGSNWESTGLIPDIIAPNESVLDTTIALAKKAAEEYGKAKDVKTKKVVQKMQIHLDQAELSYEANNSNEAESLLDSAFTIGSQAGLIDEFFIQVLAYHYSSQKKYKISIWMLDKQTKLFPTTLNGYEALAWAYYHDGNKKLALKKFEKVLELDKRNSVAARMIQQLK
jgi:tetratricopeptide (TPR) repeat protein